MITAIHARELQAISKFAISARLEAISKKIKETAELGKCSIILDYALPYNADYQLKKLSYHAPTLSPMQGMIKDELISAGYNVVETAEQTQVGGDIGFMDGETTTQTTWHIKVSW
jgi:hypothetical protein